MQVETMSDHQTISFGSNNSRSMTTIANVVLHSQSLNSLSVLICKRQNQCQCHYSHYLCLQGGRTWQPFVGSKNGNGNFRQARIYNFCVKCVVFASPTFSAGATRAPVQLLPPWPLPKSHFSLFQIVSKRHQKLIQHQNEQIETN